MAISLTVGGVAYNYPTRNDELWSSPSSDWAQAVTNQLQVVSVTGDIAPNTLVNLTNNQSSPANVTSLSFNPASIRAAFVEYYVQRTKSGEELSEAGHLYLIYNDLAADWDIIQVGANVETTGITFTVTAGGQVQYTSTNYAGQTACKMKFRARILAKT
jgi:hypothetical protein